MSTYTYTLRELGQLGVESLTLSYRSLAADALRLALPLATPTSCPVPWQYGDRLAVLDDRLPAGGGRCLYRGCIAAIRPSLSANHYALEVDLANDVDILARTIFAYINDGGDVCYGQSFYASPLSGGTVAGESLSSVLSVCKACFEWAEAGGALSSTLEADIDATVMGIAGTGSQSCWDLMRQALKWVPDAYTRMDYREGGTDALQILTTRSGSGAYTLDLAAGTLTQAGADTPSATFEQVEAISLTPRYDLVPPVVAMTGKYHAVLPEGGDVRAPGAFVYHVRSSGSSIEEEKAKNLAREAALAVQPWHHVYGGAAPLTISNAMGSVKMRQQAAEAPLKILQWWVGEGGFTLLSKLGTANLVFGRPLFEPIGASDAYPSDDGEEDSAPANYQSPEAWGTLYRLKSGTFPARSSASQNPSGLRWCRGKLTQDVWLKPGTKLPAGVTEEQVSEFFAGTWPIADGDTKNTTRYARLVMDSVWINRRHSKYRQGDNKSGESAAALALAAEEEEGGSAQGAAGDYAAALHDYYAATRKLHYDGNISLAGYAGNPNQLLGMPLNIRGARTEWEGMEAYCNAVDYDPIAGTLTLTVGSRENLSMDERLERQNLGRAQIQSNLAGNTSDSLGSSSSGSTGGGGDDSGEEDEDGEMVAPSVSAYVATTATGKPLDPFEPYYDDGKWFMNGGSIPAGSGWVTLPPKDITSVYAAGRRFHAAWSPRKKKVIYRYTTIS